LKGYFFSIAQKKEIAREVKSTTFVARSISTKCEVFGSLVSEQNLCHKKIFEVHFFLIFLDGFLILLILIFSGN